MKNCFNCLLTNTILFAFFTAKCPRSYYLLGKIRWLLKEWQNQVNRELEEDARREEEREQEEAQKRQRERRRKKRATSTTSNRNHLDKETQAD